MSSSATGGRHGAHALGRRGWDQAVAELSRRALKQNVTRFDPADARVVVFDGGKEILASFGDRLSGKTTSQLERTGVEIHRHSSTATLAAWPACLDAGQSSASTGSACRASSAG